MAGVYVTFLCSGDMVLFPGFLECILENCMLLLFPCLFCGKLKYVSDVSGIVPSSCMRGLLPKFLRAG